MHTCTCMLFEILNIYIFIYIWLRLTKCTCIWCTCAHNICVQHICCTHDLCVKRKIKHIKYITHPAGHFSCETSQFISHQIGLIQNSFRYEIWFSPNYLCDRSKTFRMMFLDKGLHNILRGSLFVVKPAVVNQFYFC